MKNTTMTTIKATDLTIDVFERKIIVSKRFAKEVSNIGSEAYNRLVQVRKDFPDFTVEYRSIDQKKDKVSYEGLTVYKMVAFIREYDKEKEEVFKGYTVIYKKQYAKIKKIFLDNYKNQYKELTAEEMAKIEKLAVELKEAEKKAKKETEKAA